MTNREKLKQMLVQHKITKHQAAAMLSVSYWAVDSWLLRESSQRHRPMPDNMIELMQYKIREL